ncbi:hypothetical protein [Duganella sp. CF402]|uniref:hypothetical protein n=1 Tax=Duganella sp. CF402 TaxID=1855289 RepID=UPI000B833691|nr:hypothetical protein [Duganella sp. CF402]
MISSNNKWLIQTLLVGLIPVLARLLMWATTSSGEVHPLAAPDFITLGLVIHVSILNETEHLLIPEQALRALLNSVTSLFIMCYGVLYTLIILGERNTELIKVPAVLSTSIVLCIASGVLGLLLFQIAGRRPE